MKAGLSYRDLVDHDFSNITRKTEYGPQINQDLLATLTNDVFNHTSFTVEKCGGLGVNVYKLLVKIIKFVISGEQWMGALRRLKDRGFDILQNLAVGLRFYDEQRFYDAGIEFGSMISTFFFGGKPFTNYRMDIKYAFKAKAILNKVEKYSLMAIENVPVWKQVLEGIDKALRDKVMIFKDGKKCV